MKKIKVAINGFGRIGRTFFRSAFNDKKIDIVAINDISSIEIIAHLLKYDSIHGVLEHSINIEDQNLNINGRVIPFYSLENPELLPWENLDVDVVVESTGLFKNYRDASLHLKSGAKKVIISAPPMDDSIPTVVFGINDHILTGSEKIISNASCTTNCCAPLVKLIDDYFCIESGYITTVHSYTTDQSLHDSPHNDLRRARAAATSIVPTTTGAAKAITKIFPHLNGKMGGCGIRVPVPAGSLTDMTYIVKKSTNTNQINNIFKNAAQNSMKDILSYNCDPIVSVDVIGSRYSCVFDSQLTSVIGKMVKVVGWYDNETGYSNRLIDLINRIFN
tara:strand:- start:4829 stop:5827 length:999 start_codon:yes stop_codon:yes gene_type:complete